MLIFLQTFIVTILHSEKNVNYILWNSDGMIIIIGTVGS